MTDRSARANDSAGGARRLAGGLQTSALALLLACVAARMFLAEMPFRVSRLKLPPAGAARAEQAPPTSASQTRPADEAPAQDAFIDRSELARVTFPVLLVAAWALWLLGGALAGRLTIRWGLLGWVILAFAGLSLVSALGASEKRAALIVWLEQAALLWAAFLAVQLFADRRRWGVLLIVLAALGATLAVKGIYQEIVERPERIADFEAYRAQRLSQLGLAEGTPQARAMALRLRSQGALGFFSLANLFGSLILVLLGAAAGVAADKLAAARRLRGEQKGSLKRGEVHVPTLAAVFTILVALTVPVVLLLTRSRGAVGATIVVALGAMAGMHCGPWVTAHWKKVALASAGLLVGGAAAVVSYGLALDRLPSRTMTFRWFYWTGAARIVAERPILGVGPGNFPDAYLRHRRPAAEEAVKNPHNILVHALVQYGVPGGLCYLAVLGIVLVGACRPAEAGRDAAAPRGPPPAFGAGEWSVMIVIVLAVLTVRMVFAGATANVWVLIMDTIFPTAVLVLMLLLFAWTGAGLSAGVESAGRTRLLLACGCVAFVLHNLVTFSAWMPGPATAFWVAAGACIAQSGAGRERSLGLLRWPLAAGAAAAVVAAAVILWRPVLAATIHTDATVRAAHDGDYASALGHAERAARADPLDPQPAADAARLALSLEAAPAERSVAAQHYLHRAYRWAREATTRNEASSAYARLAGNAAWSLGTSVPPSGDSLPPAVLSQLGKWRRLVEQAPRGPWVERALRHMARAVELDPCGLRLRIEYAQMLCEAARGREALTQLDAAEKIDAALFADSVQRLTRAQRRQTRYLREWAEAITTPATTGPAASGPEKRGTP